MNSNSCTAENVCIFYAEVNDSQCPCSHAALPIEFNNAIFLVEIK